MVRLTVVPVIPLALSEAMKTARFAISSSVMSRRAWVLLEVGVALAGGAGAAGGAGLDGPGCQPGPRHQVPRGGELAHVQPELGDDDLGGLGADAGDLVQTLQRPKRGLGRPLVGAGAGSAIVAPASGPVPVPRHLGGGDGGAQLLDPGGEAVELGGQGVGVVPQHPRQLGVVVIEAAGQRLYQGAALAAHPPPGQLGEHLGSRWPATSASSMARPETPMMSVATVPSLIRASSSSFSSRCTCRVRSWVRSQRSRV